MLSLEYPAHGIPDIIAIIRDRWNGIDSRPAPPYGESMPKSSLFDQARFPALGMLVLALLTASSCTGEGERLHILTDRKEIASAAEMYGTANPGTIVTFRHVDAVDAAAIERERPDVVIASGLSAPEITVLLRSREPGLETYGTLLGQEDSARRTRLTPLSFTLPLIAGTTETMALLPDPVTVKERELREVAETRTVVDTQGRPIRLGFSPEWNPETFVDLLLVRDIDVLALGPEFADEELVAETVEEIRRWRESIPGGAEADAAFDEKYRYIPDAYLLLDGRISFARFTFDEWSVLPDEMTKNLDIRYFKGERHIPVTSIVSAGITRESRSPKSAEALIEWLTETETQIALIDRWERDDINVFGFLGGLSSNREINETVLQERFPSFTDKIPEGHYLSAPAAFPHHWARIRDEVIHPWYRAVLADASRAGTLADAYRRWELSSMNDAEEDE